MLCLLLTALAADPGTAGFSNKGFTIADAAGKNTLNLGLSFQTRLTTTMNGDPNATDADASTDTGLRLRRMLLTANGTTAGWIDYRLRLDAARGFTFTDGADGSQQATKPLLDDAQVVFKFADPFQVSTGQWKVPFTASQMTGDTSLLFPDRPLPIDGLKYGDVKVSGFTWSRDAGVAVLGSVAEKRLEYQIGAFNGDGANVWAPTDDGFLYVARIQGAPLGELKYDEVDFERGKPRIAVGAAVTSEAAPVYTDKGARDGANRDLRLAGELRFAVSGLMIQGEVMQGTLTPAEGDPIKNFGYYAQAGYYLPIGIAPGVRFASLDPSADAEDDALTQIEGVINYYLPDPAKAGSNLGHKAQLQLSWTTTQQQGLDHALSHQAQLATAIAF